MSAYSGRRAPNVSQYISTLNTIPSDYELARQRAETDFNLEENLALFTNTNAWDFDMGDLGDIAPNVEYDRKTQIQNAAAFKDSGDGLDFLNDPDFQFPDFQLQSAAPGVTAPVQQPIQPYPFQPIAPITAAPASASSSASPTSGPHAGDKRKFDALTTTSPSTTPSLEEASRLAAEEDKRRRNTAASARFRIKKKQREQALEQSAKEMNDKVTSLEARIGQLEMENKWLRNLLTEKTSGKEEVMELWSRHVRDGAEEKEKEKEKEKERKKDEEKRDGVGTDSGVKPEEKQ